LCNRDACQNRHYSHLALAVAGMIVFDIYTRELVSDLLSEAVCWFSLNDLGWVSFMEMCCSSSFNFLEIDIDSLVFAGIEGK
jgi:hypothetical protein